MRGKNKSDVYTAIRSLPNPRLNQPDSNTLNAHVLLLLVSCLKRKRVSPHSPRCIVEGDRTSYSTMEKLLLHTCLSKMGRKGDGSLLGYFHLQFLENNVYFGGKKGIRQHKMTESMTTWLLIL